MTDAASWPRYISGLPASPSPPFERWSSPASGCCLLLACRDSEELRGEEDLLVVELQGLLQGGLLVDRLDQAVEPLVEAPGQGNPLFC